MTASLLSPGIRRLAYFVSVGAPLITGYLWADSRKKAYGEASVTSQRLEPSYDTSVFGAYRRFARSAITAAAIVADYKLTLARLPPENEHDEFAVTLRGEKLEATHRRAAAKILELCERNGGIYIKLGQHLAQMDYLLPDAYCEALRPLLNACPIQEFAVVERTLCEDLQVERLSEVFSFIEPTPVASASLAQVHRARLRTDYREQTQRMLSPGERAWLEEQERLAPEGPLVAVKVQHRGLAEALQGDIATVQFLVSAAERLFPGNFDMQWLVNEIRENLPKELDFEHELQNGERCRTYLASGCGAKGQRCARPRLNVLVPTFLTSLSTHRVLTMSYETGVVANDVAGIRHLGLRPRDVASIIDDVFTDQIFCFGFVHSDPHPGNILVRPSQEDASKPLVVLLDHGLYRELDDAFRLAYAALWQGIVEGDGASIRREALRMGVPPEDVELFTAMLTMRSWQDVVDQTEQRGDRGLRLSNERTSADKRRVQDYVRAHIMAMNRLLGRIPRPLLLLLKTNDCLRALDRRLGATSLMVEMIARKTTAILAEHQHTQWMEPLHAQRHQGLVRGPMYSFWERIRLSWRRVRLELRLLMFRLLVWWHQLRRSGDALLQRFQATFRSKSPDIR
jgi:aarF domain-containing kinase